MIKKSSSETAKIIFWDILWGIGLGVFPAVIMVVGFGFPDTLEFTMSVVIPITVLYVILQILIKYNSLSITATGVEIKSVLGKKQSFSFNEYKVSPFAATLNINFIKFAVGLRIIVTTKKTGKFKKYYTYGYNDKAIEQIANLLSEYQKDSQ